MHLAAHVGNAELVLLLIEGSVGSGGAASGFQNMTPMHIAARFGHLNVVKVLLEAKSIHPDHPDANGFTPLHLASEWGYSSIVQQLLQAGASPSAATAGLDLPIHLAAANGHTEALKMLVEADPSLASVPDKEKNTVLHYCCRAKNLDAIKVLLPLVGPSGLAAANMCRLAHHFTTTTT